MKIHHSSVLVATIVAMAILAGAQFAFGLILRRRRSSIDMAIATMCFALLSIFHLHESTVEPVWQAMSVLLIAGRGFFVYRATRSSLGLVSMDSSDIVVLATAVACGIGVSFTGRMVLQQLVDTVCLTYFFGKGFIISLRRRGRQPFVDWGPILFFLAAYWGLFIYRNVVFLTRGPTADFYSLDRLGVPTTLILLGLFSIANLGVHVSSSRQAEDRLTFLLRNVTDERDFATRLVKIIGHDLRSYIGGIRSGLSLLDDSNGSEAAIIRNNAERAESLLTDLVYWGRSRDGSSDESLDICPASLLVSLVVEDTEALAKAKNIAVGSDIPEHLLSIDRTAARVALRNIVSNALKFSRAGSSIKLTAEPVGREIGISVTDEGPGMDASIVREILSGNFVSSKTGSAGESGTGSGMRIVTSICQASNWRLAIDSRLFRGTRITVHFPIADPA